MKKTTSYYLAKTWIRISARFFDIIISSLFPIIITIIWIKFDPITTKSWLGNIISIIFSLGFLFLYFVILPWKWNGQTVGKKIFNIRIINSISTKIALKSVIIRELFITFIPFILFLIIIFLAQYNKHNFGNKNEQLLKMTIRFLWSVLLVWYLSIIIVVKIDQKQQLFFDRNHENYVVKKQPVTKKITKKEKIINICNNQQFPGVIDDEALNEIENL